jgi:hypothetical protein
LSRIQRRLENSFDGVEAEVVFPEAGYVPGAPGSVKFNFIAV